MTARFRGTLLNIAITQIYAQTAESTEEEIKKFYEDLERTIDLIPKKDIKIIMGDWNAKIGRDNSGCRRPWEDMAMSQNIACTSATQDSNKKNAENGRG